MTFKELIAKAWKISEKPLKEWKERLNNYTVKNANLVNKVITDISTLYGKPIPKRKIVVNLNYFPIKDRECGEPVIQGDKQNLFDKSIGDVLYWISERTILSTDTKEFIEEMPADTISRIIHEVEHALFQDESFNRLIQKSEQFPEINRLLDRVVPTQEHYTEFTNELITSYLDSYALSMFHKKPKIEENELQNPFLFVVDKKDFSEVLEKTIKSDVELWKGNGPRRELRVAWEKRLGSLPGGYETKSTKNKQPTLRSDKKSDKILNVYVMGRNLDTELAKKYAKKNKKIDLSFIKKVFSLVKKHLD